jgi:hypothetical protein
MTQYINKANVVAEIERRKHKLLDTIISERDKEWVVRTVHQLNRIILFLDTLEVKEVDLEKEFDNYTKDILACDIFQMSVNESMVKEAEEKALATKFNDYFNSMKASELMIGDWVLDTEFERNEPDRIGIVEDDGRVWLKHRFGYQSVTYCAPILLTPEILEKNGFEGATYLYLEIDECNVLQYYPYEHRLSKIFEGVDEWNNHAKVKDITFQCHCFYVHELQHALRLAGVEMEIEL